LPGIAMAGVGLRRGSHKCRVAEPAALVAQLGEAAAVEGMRIDLQFRGHQDEP
jgi:hypothetical protein